jgi:hypothetical protein
MSRVVGFHFLLMGNQCFCSDVRFSVRVSVFLYGWPLFCGCPVFLRVSVVLAGVRCLCGCPLFCTDVRCVCTGIRWFVRMSVSSGVRFVRKSVVYVRMSAVSGLPGELTSLKLI